MKKICSLSVLLLFTVLQLRAQPQTRTSFNDGWKFFLGNDEQAKEVVYDDAGWRQLSLPHDWSIEGTFSADNPAKPEGGALPAGIGWYRKSFTLPAHQKTERIYIDFDGAYRYSEVWVNGHRLGMRPNGYISFRYELTPYLDFGRNNVIAVKIDNAAQPNSRWYSGSGIYRNVWLVTTPRTAFEHWGSFVTTPEVSREHATVSIELKIRKLLPATERYNLKTTFYNDKNEQVASISKQNLVLTDSVTAITQTTDIPQPQLWSVYSPYRYKAVSQILQNGKVVDEYTTPFGIRYFHFDVKKGFSLNGEPMKILGVCNHHDLGALGAAVNKRAIERQLQILKKMGCNAIRTSHNPPAPELLDLCDSMGFIVMDEAFDMWLKKKNKFDYHTDFAEWHKKDLEDQILRDRNHPSILMWSIGNEIREQFDSTGITIARELVNIVKSLDKTRPVTAALSENKPGKNFLYQSHALDLVGLNYHHESYDTFAKMYPGEVFIGTENVSALETRGQYDQPSTVKKLWPKDSKEKYVTKGNPGYTVSAYDQTAAYWGSTHEETWKLIKKYPFLSGFFIWTGFDYIGEPTPYPYPARSSYFGIIDLAGFPKDVYYMYQSEWTSKPVLHILPHWNWKPGQTVDVWVYYNNADEVELFLNGKSLGIKKKKGNDLHIMWRVKYQPGTLKAISRKYGADVMEKEVKTAGKPAKIQLVADRKKIAADGKDLSFITVNILDANGNLVPNADNQVSFYIKGEGFIAGVDNGYQASLESFKANHRKAFNGKCLAIVQSSSTAGTIQLEAVSAGLKGASVEIETAK